MIIKVHGFEIECPDKMHLIALVKRMNSSQARYLSNRQKEPKNWPEHTNIPEYCIYMGSDMCDKEKIDFYHYEETKNREYSSAMVTGNEGGDYRSGWPELASKRGNYEEQLRREFHCGFLTVDDLARIGMARIGVWKECWGTIRPMRKGFRLTDETI